MTIEEWLGKDNKLGQDIWYKKYQYNNETFDEWLDRITDGNEKYKELMIKKQFLPGGRILSNRGLYKDGVKVTYSNCYVIPAPEDNIESIFDTAKMMARTFSYGGGVGIDISNLAPSGAKVNNTAKHTSGAVSFMDLYSLVTGLIGQNGRRGALMISLDCDHPDVENFIELKSDLDKVTKANISIKVTNQFMDAVKNDKNFKLSFTREETGEEISKVIKAKELFEKMCYMNWDYAEPGVLFWDRIRNWNLLSNDPNFEYAGVNPCAEEPLPAGGSCLLGSLNLDAFVKEGQFDENEFAAAVETATYFLNDILDEGLALHPLDIQKQTVGDLRQIGLGIMGLADALIHMGIKYGSSDAVLFVDKIGSIMINKALQTSAILARERGTYEKYNKDLVMTSNFFASNADLNTYELVEEYGLRNSQLLTCAPTGTLSTMLGISGGIEPIFANFYMRKTQSLHGHDEWYKVYTPIVQNYMKKHNITEEELPDFFVTSADLKPIERVAMQAALQAHVDASISSTVNIPNEATVEDVKEIYLQAYEYGLKGITIYRSGCKREGVLVETPSANEPCVEDLDSKIPAWGTVLPVRGDLVGIKKKIVNGCGKFHLELFYDEKTQRPWETFISLGDGGGCERNLEFISKLMSKCLRAGVSIEELIETAKSIRPCPAFITRTMKKGDTSKGTSCANCIGFALEDFMNKIKTGEHKQPDENKNISIVKEIASNDKSLVCPECGAKLTHEGGCDICRECGYSHCG